MKQCAELNIAEIPYENGTVKFRYARKLSADGSKWIRHGLFQQFYETGEKASEGQYENDLEIGLWRDFHKNGQIAAQGHYSRGQETGTWEYWNEDGDLEEVENF
jgi:antitoxin component YwqK of YwqJK toxin-antitoxin module